MGRRFLLILGILLMVPPAGAPARAQDGGGPPGPDPAPAMPAEPPLPRPLALPATDGNLPPIEQPMPAPEPVEAPPRKKDAGKDKDSQPAVPSLEPVGNDDAPGRAPGPAIPPDDRNLTRTEGTPEGPAARRPIATAPAASAAGDPDGSPAGRLPAGKQSVAVTVDVQSPPSLNLYQPARVLIIVKNSGASDALQVHIRDELPEGLKFLSSDPPPDPGGRDAVLSWSRPVLPAGKNLVIALMVEPVKTGDLEHGASVSFQTGSSAASKVFQPRLTIEQTPSTTAVLKGHAVEFRIRVRNDGDGPARDVKVVARLSPGLRYGSGRRAESEVVTDPIPVLAPGQVEELDPLVAEAIAEGPANCTVTAKSKDVIVRDKAQEARSVVEVKVVEPKLDVAISGPQRRCTDTVAPYEIMVKNPGTAVAKKVRVVAVVPPGVRLRSMPDGARYDQATRRLQWSLDTVEPGSTPKTLGFEVTVGDVGKYEIAAEAFGSGGLKAEAGRLVTEVFGMPDVVLVVNERQRVVDVKGKTVFVIELQNIGTKEATNLVLSATVSKNLIPIGSFDVPPGMEFRKGDGQVILQDAGGGGIKRLAPGKKLVMGLEVEVAGAEPKVGTCRVQVKHDELPEGVDAMAHVKILPPSGSAGAAGR